MTRLMSDTYGNDIVRSQMESTNQKANAKNGTAAFAETFRASRMEIIYGRKQLETLERLNNNRRNTVINKELLPA